MKRKLALLFCTMIVMVTGCSQQSIVKEYGGTMIIELEPGQKLEEITWKDNELWYLTRPFTKNDIPETHTFQEQSEFGVFEGTITIIEKEGDKNGDK